MSNLFFTKNYIELNDDYVGLFSKTVHDFYYQMGSTTYQTADVNEGPGLGYLYYQEVQFEKSTDIFVRQVYSFTNLLQEIGGFFNAVYFGGFFIYYQFRSSIFFSELINKLYQVELDQGDHKNGKEIVRSFDSEEESSSQTNKEPKSPMKLKSKNLKAESMKDNFVIQKTTLEGIKDYLKHRWRLKLTARDICRLTVMSPLFSKCLNQKRKDTFD